MTAVQDRVRVCPRCGSPAETHDFCVACGLHLAVLPELPSMGEWKMRMAAPAAMPRGRVASVRPLLHPSETSRLILAILAAFVLTGGLVAIAVAEDGAPVLLGVTVIIMVIGASVWAGQQI